jgi:serine/threonine-protein kinase RsbW
VEFDLKYDLWEKLVLPMEADRELEAAGLAERLALAAGFGRDPVDEIKIAVIEAVLNAMEHSNSADRKVYVYCGLKKEPLRLAVIVTDSGKGFDPDQVEFPDIRRKMRPGSRKRGWGLRLIRSLMDEVRIESSAQGSRVIMFKNG